MSEEEVNEAEDGASEGDEDEDDEGGNSKKKLIILIALPILLLAIGGGVFFSGILDSEEDVVVEGEEAHAEETAEDATPASSAFFALPDFIVNLSSDQGSRFLKLRVQLEIENEADLAAIEAVTPRVIDQFQTYLREMRVEDLRGSAGIYRLRQELLYRVNIAAHPVKVTDVLFQEMLIQ